MWQPWNVLFLATHMSKVSKVSKGVSFRTYACDMSLTHLIWVMSHLFCPIVVVLPSHRCNYLWILKSNLSKETYSHRSLLRIYRPLLPHRRCRAESSPQLPVNEIIVSFLSHVSFFSSNVSLIHVNRSLWSVNTSLLCVNRSLLCVNTSLLCGSFVPSHCCNYLWMW